MSVDFILILFMTLISNELLEDFNKETKIDNIGVQKSAVSSREEDEDCDFLEDLQITSTMITWRILMVLSWNMKLMRKKMIEARQTSVKLPTILMMNQLMRERG